MRSVSIKDIGTAVLIFNSKIELETPDIKKLFQVSSDTTVSKLKKQVWEVMTKQGVKCFSKTAINKRIAFEVWNLDIGELEAMYKKQKQLGFVKE